jgi:hypothetical protein
VRTGALLGLLLSVLQGAPGRAVRELRAIVRESSSRNGADSVACPDGGVVAASIRRDHEGRGRTN